VRLAIKYTGEFSCVMRIEPYPFDTHVCHIDLTVPTSTSAIVLDGSLGTTLSASPEGFRAVAHNQTVYSMVTRNGNQSYVTFTYAIERDPTFALNAYVMMGWLLVILAMCAFWIPEEAGNMDRVGLAITTVLASTVLQTEAKVSMASTWLDVFFTVCTVFQAVTFLISIVAGRTMGERTKKENERTKKEIHRAAAAHAGAVVAATNSATTRRCSLARASQLTLFSAAQLQKYRGLKIWSKRLRQLIGKPDDDWHDLFGIRVLVPAFFCINIVLPLSPHSMCEGKACPEDVHRLAGVSCPLFIVNTVMLVVWIMVAIMSSIMHLQVIDLKKVQKEVQKEKRDEANGGKTYAGDVNVFVAQRHF